MCMPVKCRGNCVDFPFKTNRMTHGLVAGNGCDLVGWRYGDFRDPEVEILISSPIDDLFFTAEVLSALFR